MGLVLNCKEIVSVRSETDNLYFEPQFAPFGHLQDVPSRSPNPVCHPPVGFCGCEFRCPSPVRLSALWVSGSGASVPWLCPYRLLYWHWNEWRCWGSIVEGVCFLCTLLLAQLNRHCIYTWSQQANNVTHASLSPSPTAYLQSSLSLYYRPSSVNGQTSH